jgi:hypothetical protein
MYNRSDSTAIVPSEIHVLDRPEPVLERVLPRTRHSAERGIPWSWTSAKRAINSALARMLSATKTVAPSSAILSCSPGSPVFAQEHGLSRRRFTIFKLRTVTHDASCLMLHG